MHYPWCWASKRSIAVQKETLVQPSTVCFILREKNTHETRKIVGICMQVIPKVEIVNWAGRTTRNMIQIQIAVIDCFKCWTFHFFIQGIYLALKSSATKLCLSFTSSLLCFPVLNRSLVESERSFRYDKSALLLNSFHWNIPKGKPRNLKTYHSYCNPGWDVPNQSVFSWRLKSFRLVSWAVAAVCMDNSV